MRSTELLSPLEVGSARLLRPLAVYCGLSICGPLTVVYVLV